MGQPGTTRRTSDPAVPTWAPRCRPAPHAAPATTRCQPGPRDADVGPAPTDLRPRGADVGPAVPTNAPCSPGNHPVPTWAPRRRPGPRAHRPPTPRRRPTPRAHRPPTTRRRPAHACRPQPPDAEPAHRATPTSQDPRGVTASLASAPVGTSLQRPRTRNVTVPPFPVPAAASCCSLPSRVRIVRVDPVTRARSHVPKSKPFHPRPGRVASRRDGLGVRAHPRPYRALQRGGGHHPRDAAGHGGGARHLPGAGGGVSGAHRHSTRSASTRPSP